MAADLPPAMPGTEPKHRLTAPAPRIPRANARKGAVGLPIRAEDLPLPDNSIPVLRAYPPVGQSQHLVIVRDPKSTVPPNPQLYLEEHEVYDTVLASAFYPVTTVVPSRLPAPHNFLALPPLDKRELRPEWVFDGRGRKIGKLLQVPSLHVTANQLILHHANPNYDHAAALAKMVEDGGRLMATVVNAGILKVREAPGVMAHLQTDTRLRPDEVGISTAFAAVMARRARDEWGFPIKNVRYLDGYPCVFVRYPLANEWGAQKGYLRILPGKGRYVAVAARNLSDRLLGDEDGDIGFVLLRVQDMIDHKVMHAGREWIGEDHRIPTPKSRLSLADVLQPSKIEGFDEKLIKKIDPPDYRTQDSRMQFFRDADTRQHVSVYTMVAWWVARVLSQAKVNDTLTAHRRAYNMLEWFMENAMDARKGSKHSAMAGSGVAVDKYVLMSILMKGGTLPVKGLQSMGMPHDALKTLTEAWTISGGNLRAYCEQDPVYRALVLERNDLPHSIPPMLRQLQELGVPPDRLYRTVIDNLTIGHMP